MAEKETRRLWDSPIYRFRVPPKADGSESGKLVEIVFDVTGSAPSFNEPSDELVKILSEIFKSKTLKAIDTVMEFGAAKLKNIPFILKQGKTVTAVEFEKLMKNPKTISTMNECKVYGTKFKKILFPNPFIEVDASYDLVLLLNVPPVMPVFAERLYLLDVLHTKVKDGKYLLWVAQKEGSYKADRESGKYSCGDGIWQGKNRHFKTFYRYHHPSELDELMSLYGFKLVEKWNLGSDARLYEKTQHNLFAGLLTEQKILNTIPNDGSIADPATIPPKMVKKSASTPIITPNPEEFCIESLYIEKLQNIPHGPDHAESYHRVISHALGHIFRVSLRNMEIKVDIKDGVKIIDTLFTNCAKDGFFHNLKDNVTCTYPIIEVKNYSDDTKNPEVDQLNGRFNKNHGHFGIIACRQIQDEDKMYSRCATVLPDSIILFLTDKDIIELLKLSGDGSTEEISDFMDKKLRTLLFKKG